MTERALNDVQSHVAEYPATKQRAEEPDPAERLFAGPGEMRALCRSFDWSKTPLGPVEGWPEALRVAADRPKLVAGAVSVAGQLPTGRDEVRPTGPVPVMVVYGAKDPVRPVTGLAKPGPAPKGQEPIMATKSARSSVKAFATAGRTKPPVERPRKGYDRTVWRPGPGTVPAELLVVRDAGHTWPGTRVTPPEGFGPASKALDTTGTVLGFLTDQSPRPPHGAAKTQEHSDR